MIQVPQPTQQLLQPGATFSFQPALPPPPEPLQDYVTPLQGTLDIQTTGTVTLTDCSVFCLPTRICKPLPSGYHALLSGRSSTLVTELFVIPGVIDSDTVREIKIMAWTRPVWSWQKAKSPSLCFSWQPPYPHPRQLNKGKASLVLQGHHGFSRHKSPLPSHPLANAKCL